jgi:membrane-bound metal-dependent hydrolase YbcI (DUF457 family)
VDPVSHALFGRALNCLDRHKRFGKGAGAAFVLGSLAPDIDGALVAKGWDVYLSIHPSGTHTLLAAPVLAAATAALVRVFARQSSYRRLCLAAFIGVVIGHLLFDLVSGSDMRLLAPIDTRAFGPHLLTMADVSAIAILVGGTMLSFWRRRAGGIAIVLGLAALLAGKAVSLQRAWQVYRTHAADADRVASPEAFSGSLVAWRFYDRAGDVARVWTVDGWQRSAAIDFARPVNAGVDPALVAISKRSPAVERFLGFSELPLVRLDTNGGRPIVVWSDLKYCERERCVMSFGAVIDRDGNPAADVVQIGGYIRTRALR